MIHPVDILEDQELCLRLVASQYRYNATALSSGEVAARSGLSDADVADVLRTLTAQGLVQSTPSGYLPTRLGTDLLMSLQSQTRGVTALRVDGDGAFPVLKVDIIDLHQPWGSFVVVYGSEPFVTLTIGGRVRLGPFSGANLFISAHVEALDHRARTFLGHIDEFYVVSDIETDESHPAE